MFRRLPPPPLHRLLAAWLVCAMLLVQMLGLVHRIAHAHGPSHATHDHGRIEALFDHHHDLGDCQIFDQLSHADGAGFAFVEPGAMPPAPPPAPALQALQLAAQAAGYLARGPPRTA